MEGEASYGSYSTHVYSSELLGNTQSVKMPDEREMKTESLALRPAGASEPEVMGIFGTGDLGRSLGLRLLQSGYRVVYGSRRPHSCGPVPQGAQVASSPPQRTEETRTRSSRPRVSPIRWRLTQKQPGKPP